MADDIFPTASLPDEAELAARARAARVNPDVLSDLTRIRVLHEFRTEAERQSQEEQDRTSRADDVRRYNAYFDKYGIWNAKFRGW